MGNTIEAHDSGAKRVTRIAYAALACAAGLPIAASYADTPMNAFSAGRWLGQAAMTFLLAVAVVALLLRGRSLLVQAYGRLLVCVGMLAWAVAVTALAASEAGEAKRTERELVKEFMQASVDARKPQTEAPPPATPAIAQQGPVEAKAMDPHAREKAFVRGGIERSASLQRQFTALDKRFQSLDLSQALTPETLTDPTAIVAMRGRLRQFSALVDERGQALKRYSTDIEAYFRDADIDEVNRRAAFEGYRAPNAKAQNAFAELDAAQRATVAAIGEMLTFAESNMGKMRPQDGRMLFADQEQLDRYSALLGRIQAGAAREEAATEKIQRLQKASQQAMVDNLSK